MPSKPKSKNQSAKASLYLQIYNAISAIAWLWVIGQTFIVGDSIWWLRAVQTAAVMETVHAMLGLVKSSVFSTAAQLGSRLWIVWFMVSQQNAVYKCMVVTWGIAEIIRYLYYLHSGMKWLRYTLFIALYPIGATCEVLVMNESTIPWIKYVMMFWPVAFIYLYGHMWQQRKKQLK